MMMFDYLNGIVTEKGEDYIIVEIGGIGYKIYVSANTISDVMIQNKSKIYTHLHVKEDELILYGFSNKAELKLFKLLISVKSVGPKAALSLLSCFKPNDLLLAIGTKDTKSLKQVPGIGEKTAERIILELRDKINVDLDLPNGDNTTLNNMSEVIEALMSLGYIYSEAANAFSMSEDKEKSLNDLIKEALKQLSRV